jgi:transaldolase
MNPLLRLHAIGQRVWLDNLSRTLLRENSLRTLINDDKVAGVTSNPSIFLKAISESPYYREELATLRRDPTLSAEARYESLAIADIREACDLLRPLHAATGGDDGYVSLEVSPALAHDADGTVAAGLRLKAAVDRDNLMIKVPATAAGLAAIETLIAAGCPVNVTLMFSLKHVDEVAAAYDRGIRRYIAGGGNPLPVKSVASVFLSRIDTLVDGKLDTIGGEALALRGKTAVALARLAYARFQQRTRESEFKTLAATSGARPQILLWASTGTKNPAYSDVLYVESVIGAETVNTLPDATLAAFRDHGKAEATLTLDPEGAARHVDAVEALGIDLTAAGEQLQAEGLRQFEDAYAKLLQITGDQSPPP